MVHLLTIATISDQEINGRGQRQRKQAYDADAETEVYEPSKKKMQKSRISWELRINEVYESPIKNYQQSKVSREIGTSYDADDEDVFPESTTDEDSDDLDLNEWAQKS